MGWACDGDRAVSDLKEEIEDLEDEIEDVEDDLEEAEEDVAEAQRKAEPLTLAMAPAAEEAPFKELAGLNEELRELKRALPNSSEIASLLRDVSNTANRVGLEVRRFERIDEIPLTYYAEIPAKFEVYGSYHRVARFFDELARMKRIVTVQRISMGSPEEQDGEVRVTVTGQVVTFRLLTEAELGAQSSGKKGKKKGRRGGKKGG